ncbi:MAG: ABC transporter substrate-binding protein [Acidimicrobiia bacterium]
MTKTRRALMVLTACALVALAACSDSDGDDDAAPADGSTTTTGAPEEEVDEPIEISFQPSSESLTNLPQMHAFAMDYFAEEGLEVEYLPVIANAQQALQSVLTGNADISHVGSTATVAAILARQDVVAVGSQTPNVNLVLSLRNEAIDRIEQESGVTPDSPIADRVEALKGLTIALPGAGSTGDAIMRGILESFDVNPDADLTLQPINDVAAAVASTRERQSDGIFHGLPAAVQGTAEGYSQVWISLAAGDVPQYEAVPLIDIVTSRGFLDDDPEAVRRWLRAMVRALDDINERPDEVRAAVKERWFPDMDEALYDAAFDTVLPSFDYPMTPTEENFEGLIELYNAGQPQPATLSFDDYYDLSLLEEVLAE